MHNQPLIDRPDVNPEKFSACYTALRESEGRMYMDEEVIHLPDISKHHPHYNEWHIRKHTVVRFIQYLKNKHTPLNILEVGCGNGWLSARMAAIPGALVTGIDVNDLELEQARRVFNHKKNLRFLYGDLYELVPDNSFDIIVFAASIQYFQSLQPVLNTSFNRLEPGGEIHIFDTFFYNRADITAAQERSAVYYEALGFPEMQNYYFHHCIDDLHPFNYKMMYNPHSFINKLMKNKNPFHWICVRLNPENDA